MLSNYLKIILLLVLPMINLVVHASDKSQLSPSAIELTVYKTPSCGCCKKWIDHIEQQGIVAQSKNFQSIGLIKSKYGIEPNYRSCHTAVSADGFVFEGHVPAKFIEKFLAEQHLDAIGLSVPAMPVGTPGMEVGDQFMPYQVLLLRKDGTSEVYAQVNTYQEQF